MESIFDSRVYHLFVEALDQGNLVEAAQILETVRAPDRADFFNNLSLEHQLGLFPLLKPDLIARTLVRIEPVSLLPLLSKLDIDLLLPVFDQMPDDDQADFIDALPPEQSSELLPLLKKTDVVKKLMLYPENTAGALMTPQLLSVSQRLTAEQGVQAVRRFRSSREDIHYVFVTDHLNRLKGIVSLFELIQAPPAMPISEFMDKDVVYVEADTDQEECAQLFNRYDQITMPVVDNNRRILGIIAVDDLVDVLVKEADEDIARMGAAHPIEGSYLKANIVSMVRNRASWLVMLFVAASLTTTIIASFESELEAVAVLAVFIPLLIGTGGNAGAQTTTTIIRAMAMNEVSLKDGRAVWLKEISVGSLLGLVMGIMASGLSYIMFSNPQLSGTVGVTIFCIVLAANFVGSLLPLIARRLKLDPTLVSGPAITTLVDSLGLIIYFSVAHLFFNI